MKDPKIDCVVCGKRIDYAKVHPGLRHTVIQITCGTCHGGSMEIHIVGHMVSVHSVLRLGSPDDAALLDGYKTNIGTLLGPAVARRFLDTVKLVQSWVAAKQEEADS